jgi:hypothetical protein
VFSLTDKGVLVADRVWALEQETGIPSAKKVFAGLMLRDFPDLNKHFTLNSLTSLVRKNPQGVLRVLNEKANGAPA